MYMGSISITCIPTTSVLNSFCSLFLCVCVICVVLVMSGQQRPPVTFHVLDTAAGRPASGLLVEICCNKSLDGIEPFVWEQFGQCLTTADGRGSGLLPASMTRIPVGTYKIKFHTKEYFAKTNTMTFYPFVRV